MSEREKLVAALTDYVTRYEDNRVWADTPAEAARDLADMADRYAGEKTAAELERQADSIQAESDAAYPSGISGTLRRRARVLRDRAKQLRGGSQ